MVLDMTTGKPIKKIVSFLIPLILGNLLQLLYSLADSVIVSRTLGVKAFAGVSATGSLNFLVLGFTWGLCAGCTIPISQEFGANDYAKMRRCFANSFYLLLISGAVIGLGTALGTPAILRLIGTPEDIFGYSAAYISIIFAGIPASVLYNLLAGAMRAVGDGRTPLIMLVISTCLNIALDLLFILEFRMDVAGSAVATVLAQLISGFLCLYVIFTRFDILKVRRDEWKADLRVIGRMAGLGLPMGLQFSITAIGGTILQSSVNSLGSDIVAAIGAGGKVQQVFNTPIEALGTTMATYCGQNLGARRMDRVRKGTLQITLLSAGYCAFAYLMQLAFGPILAKLFIGDAGDALLQNVCRFLNVVTATVFLLALVMIYRNAVQGLGYSAAAMLAGIAELFGRVFVALVLVRAFGFDGACYANPAAWLAADLLLVPMYLITVRRCERRFAREG